MTKINWKNYQEDVTEIDLQNKNITELKLSNKTNGMGRLSSKFK